MSMIAQSPITLHPAYVETVTAVALCARTKLPESANARLARAVDIVMRGGVRPSVLVQGGCHVASQSQPDGYEVAGDTCTCPDAAYRQDAQPCKHVLAAWLYRRVEQRLLRQEPESTPLPSDTGCQMPIDTDGTPCHATGSTCTHHSTFDPQWIVDLHGKKFVLYAGLLALAHQHGLTSLEAEITTYVDGVIAIAKATAIFADGRRFSESADATPGNVTAKIRPHFVRMALTRAKARALRDALNIGMTALEELGE